MTYTDEWPKRYRVFIVDDHPLIRQVLTRMLAAESDLEVIGAVASAEEALKALEELSPDIALVDYSLPGMSGLDLIKLLRHDHPNVCCLMFSSCHERFYVDAALRAGARGYVVKGEPEALLRAIAKVKEGHPAIDVA